MKLQFIGAAHEVTGSCHYLEVDGRHILVDCGMEQGVNTFENCAPSGGRIRHRLRVFNPCAHRPFRNASAAVCQRFSGEDFATQATADLCSIMLRDCAHIQMQEAEWKNRKAKRHAGIEPHEPLYTMEDAVGTIGLISDCPYGEIISVCPGVRIRFTDVGHLLGSASIEVWAQEGDVSKKLVFSGDIGNVHQPLLRDPQLTAEADYVIMESTYGDRLHGKSGRTMWGNWRRFYRRLSTGEATWSFPLLRWEERRRCSISFGLSRKGGS